MTNEVKANILSNEIAQEFDSKEMVGYECAIKMALWKDEQFSKFLLWLDDHYVIRRFTDGEPMTYGELIDAFKNMDK